jgi:hypothetical protein
VRTSAWLVAFTLAAGCGDPGAGGPDAALDAPSLDAGKDAACASSFGDALTAAFGRVDGTVVAVVAPGTERCAMPNRDHVIVRSSSAARSTAWWSTCCPTAPIPTSACAG